MKLLNIKLQETDAICESCGHDIKWKYLIELDTKATMTVGSDCAETMLSKDVLETLKRRTNAAKREWRAKLPTPRENETREAYIDRRLTEKSHAVVAWRGYQSLVRRLNPGYGLLHLSAVRVLNDRGVFDPGGFPHGKVQWCDDVDDRRDCKACQELDRKRAEWELAKKATQEELLLQIEQEYLANRFDFLGKAIYDVKKV